VFILGDRDHPEVQGVLSQESGRGEAVGDVQDLEKIKVPGKIGVLAQTTQPVQKLEAMAAGLVNRTAEIKIINTLCPVTLRRQREAWDLAKRVDTMLVIGGKNSANTNRLYELCREANPNTYQVELPDELDVDWIGGREVIGVTAGTSTPMWLIEAVRGKLTQRGEPGAVVNTEEKEG
jgi:4-hydroxy-3-methylbut-2-enyl diphosphate reductase